MKKQLSSTDLETVVAVTVNHYESSAQSFWEGTRDHDVSQNYAAFIAAMPAKIGLRILDLGCGPGRDLRYFKKLGHLPTGLDGSSSFCEMARTYSGCPTLNQSFLQLSLNPSSFDGVFANASLFHVPAQELPRVLGELKAALATGGILFSSNPRGSGEGWSGRRFGNYMEWDEYKLILEQSGFTPLRHYYRPEGLACEQQPWLAVVARRD